MTDAVFANQPPVLSAPRRLRLPNRRRAFALALGGALLLAAVVVAGLMAGRPPRRPISPPRACPLRFRTRSAPTGWAATCSCARWPAFPPACSWASWPAVASSLIALALAAAAALGPRWADHAVSWLIDLMMGIPHIVLLILISYALGKGFWGVTIGVALTHWPSLARILRAEILQCASSDFVAAAAVSVRAGSPSPHGTWCPMSCRSSSWGSCCCFPTPSFTRRPSPSSASGCRRRCRPSASSSPRPWATCRRGCGGSRCSRGWRLCVCVSLFDVVGTSLLQASSIPAYAQE